MLGLEFNLAAFNVFLRWRLPVFFDGQRARAERLGRFLDDPSFDAIALSEVFDPASRSLLLDALRDAFPHRTHLVGARNRNWLRGNGGVMILSRWPIEDEDERVFEPRAPLEERFVNKGVVYARIRKGDQPIHVFAAHVYARFRPHDVRFHQFEIMRDFIRARAIGADEPVLIAGDLNVHRQCVPDYRAMLDVLDAEHPETEGHDATYDPTHNPLALGSARLYLDYVLFSRAHRLPDRASNEVLRPTCSEWRSFPWQTPRRDLSDHYPVVGRFAF